ncbi:nucleotidyltransferase [Pasteurellaceae bacterium RH1A]|nr:nucleotidyltransferase [Pasteurellaceae bacterium RH1A]
MSLSIEHLQRTADTLEQAIEKLAQVEPDDILYDLFRNAAIKSFELSLETTGKLLRKLLKLYVGSPKEIDRLVFNDLFRYAGQYELLDEGAVGRWLNYRANRNNTAHDYGVDFANETLQLLPDYLQDLRALSQKMQEVFDAQT